MRVTIRSALWLAAITAAVSAQAENWPRFRGPTGQGISNEVNLPVRWTETENVAWKTQVPGNAWSSPIVYDEKIFLTTATEEGVSCRVICVDRESGNILWNTEVHRQVPGAKRRQNSYATPTPVTDGVQVYAVFYDGTVVAVDFAGNLVWKNSDVKFYSIHGLGASPILVHDQLIMPFDGSSRDESRVGFKTPWSQAFVLSLDTDTGAVRWNRTADQPG